MKRMLLIAALIAAALVSTAAAGQREITASLSPEVVYVGDYTADIFRVTVCGPHGFSIPFTVTEPDGEVEEFTLYLGPDRTCRTFSFRAYEVGEYLFSFYDRKGNFLVSVSGQAIDPGETSGL